MTAAVRRVALVHNEYCSARPSGEDAVVEEEGAVLSGLGIDVRRYRRSNDCLENASVGRLVLTALGTPWSWASYKGLRRFIADFKPDIVHIHNTFPLVTYSAVDACYRSSVPCVVTLHNYRCFCPNAMMLRAGSPCRLCLDERSTWSALRHRCYRQSLRATVPIAASIELERIRKSLRRRADVVIALTQFQARMLAGDGFREGSVVVKPNCIPLREEPLSPDQRDLDFVFVGRLSEEKGLQVLLDAWSALNGKGGRLAIIGDGPLRSAVAGHLPPLVEYLGRKSRPEVIAHLRRAKALLLPSTWYEGFPLTVVEAFSCGVPVIASRIGGIPEIVKERETGLLVQPGNPKDWADAVSTCLEDWGNLAAMGARAFSAFKDLYCSERNGQMLLSIYESAIARHAPSRLPK
jgi:glycosyltransferase involved in cell wall biosynthesis